MVVRESTGESSSLVVAFFTRLLCSTSMPVVALELAQGVTAHSYPVTHGSANPRPFIRDANQQLCGCGEAGGPRGSMNEIGVSRRDRWQRSKGSQVSDVERRVVVFTCRV